MNEILNNQILKWRRVWDLAVILGFVVSACLDARFHYKFDGVKINELSIIITSISTIVSIIISVSTTLYNQKIVSLNYQEFRRLRRQNYSTLEIIIVTVLLVITFASVAVPRYVACMIEVSIVAGVYAIIFAIQEIPLLDQNAKRIKFVIKQAELHRRKHEERNEEKEN